MATEGMKCTPGNSGRDGRRRGEQHRPPRPLWRGSASTGGAEEAGPFDIPTVCVYDRTVRSILPTYMRGCKGQIKREPYSTVIPLTPCRHEEMANEVQVLKEPAPARSAKDDRRD